MSRLHDPGPGEMLDRLTILALKICHGVQAGRAVTHWEEEQAALARQYSQTVGLSDPSADTQYGLPILLSLAAVNAALWQAEDELRWLRTLPEGTRGQCTRSGVWVMDVAHVALRIQQLNDRRAELVALINEGAGVLRPGEKL